MRNIRETEHSTGWIEVICGVMFSGKSEELIRRIKRADFAKHKVQVFKPDIDNRYTSGCINSHSGMNFKAISVQQDVDLISLIDPDTKVVAVDEIQFFHESMVNTLEKIADSGIRVIVAGLELDFRGEPFGIMPRILCVAEYVDKLHSICVKCSAPATRTQRLIDNKPAKYDDPVILVGASDSYEPRCRKCHTVVHSKVSEAVVV